MYTFRVLREKFTAGRRQDSILQWAAMDTHALVLARPDAPGQVL